MGIKERHERDREAVRRAILDAARELFVNEGYRNVSIRKVAEKIEYSPAAIYGYFPSKDDIFYALAEEGFHLLHPADSGAALDAGLAALEPLERLLESHRPGSDDIFQVLPVQAIFKFKPAAAERIGHIDHDFIRLERLDNVSKSTHVQRSVRQHRAVETGYHDDRGVRMCTQDIADQIHP